MSKEITVLAILATAVFVGCSTPDINPPAPRAKTGYVDFYTDSNLGVSWKVKRAMEPDGELRSVFSEFKPVRGNILRLATPAGKHRFEVWFSNQVTTGPQTVDVEVGNASVTPVRVTLTPAGSTSVMGQAYEYRSTPKATRRVTRISGQEQNVYEIGATAAAPQEYRRKEEMPYFAPEAK